MAKTISAELQESNFAKYRDNVHRVGGFVFDVDTRKVYMEYTTSDGKTVISSFHLTSEGISSEHWCMAIATGTPCWHLAAGATALHAAVGGSIDTKLSVELRNPDPITGGIDITPLVMAGKAGEFTILTPDSKITSSTELMDILLGATPSAQEKEEEGEEKPPVPEITIERSEDQWLSKLNLPTPILQKVLDFRKSQDERYRTNPRDILRVPNMGTDTPANSSIASYFDKDDLDTVRTLDYYPADGEVEEALRFLLLKGWSPICLRGNASTGKTAMAYYLACILKLPVIVLSGSTDIDREELIGFRDLRPLDNGGFKTVHVEGALLRAVRRGEMLIFNEINMALPSVLSVLNDVLDWQRRTFVAGQNEVLADPSFRFIGTMNPGYVGTQELNEALSSRFHYIEIGYPPIDVVLKIIVKELAREGEVLPDREMAKLLIIYERIRSQVESSQLDQELLSLRSLTRAAITMVFSDDKDAVTRCIVSGNRDLAAHDIVKDIVDAVM